MSFTETTMQYTIDAVDKASGVFKTVSDNSKTASNKVIEANNKTEVSSRQMALAVNNVASSAMGLYLAYDRVADSQMAVDAANIKVQRTTETLRDAKANLVKVMANESSTAEEIRDAQNKVAIATDALSLAEDRAADAAERQNQTLMSSALMVIPSVITMATSLKVVLSGAGGLTSAISGIGPAMTTATTAATVGLTSMLAMVGVVTAGIAAAALVIYGMYVAWEPLNKMWQEGYVGMGGIGASKLNAEKLVAEGAPAWEVTDTTASYYEKYKAWEASKAASGSTVPITSTSSSITLNVTAPLVNIEGTVDEATAQLAANLVESGLKNMIISPTSTNAQTSNITPSSKFFGNRVY